MIGKIKTHIKYFTSKNKITRLKFLRAYNIFRRRLSRRKEDCPLHEAWLLPFMKTRKSFVDVGANLGQWTFHLAPTALKVYSFEPNPRTYKALTEKAKQYPNVEAYPYALGSFPHTAHLNMHKRCGRDSLLRAKDDFVETALVEVKTLDSFNLSNIGLINIDTEGYETRVLRGAKDTIQRNRPRIIVEVHWPFKEQRKKITMLLNKMGYYSGVVRPQWLHPQPHIIAVDDVAS